jgi:hypothetical protein
MTRYIYVVLSSPREGREDEYNEWYSNRHIPDVLALGPFSSARRLKVAKSVFGEPPAQQYLAFYETDEEPADALAALEAARGTDRLAGSDAIDPESVASWFIESVDLD